MIIQVNGVDVTVNGVDANPDWQARIQRTLALLPPAHVRHLHHLTVRDRADYAGGSTNWVSRADHSRGCWIMLDSDSFDPRVRAINNRPPDFLNYTLLHEMGHVVDQAYSGLRTMRREDRAGYRILTEPSRTGSPEFLAHHPRTSGAGEDFGDVYADLFFYRESERPTDERMQALLRSAAFAGLDVARRP